jgi:hypothetical protein
MKRFTISTMLWSLLLLSVFSCQDLGVKPATDETATPLIDITKMEPVDMAQANNGNENKIILYLNYTNKKTEKIEVNRHQATLNFDNHDPKIVNIIPKGKMVNLKNFRAEYNQLEEIPGLALVQGIKGIEVAHNSIRIHKLLDLKDYPSLELLDISYNKKYIDKDLFNLILPKGAILNLTATGVSKDKEAIKIYKTKYPYVTVITDDYDKKNKLTHILDIK